MINKIYLSAIAATVLLFTSCDNSKKEDKNESTVPVTVVAKEAVKEGKSITVTTEQVPDTIRTSFMKKYPKATKTVWMQYEPGDNDDLKMDDQYYYVTYYSDGADYTSWYNNHGEWVKTSTKVPGNAKLPDAVNKTINDQYPGYAIVEIDKENDKDMEMYEIELKKGEEKAKLKILPNGTIFKRK